MKNDLKVLPRWTIHFFLWLGLTAGVAVRSLTLAQRLNPPSVIWIWRFAMVSYTIFFGYRYIITRRRRRVIANYHLLDKVEAAEALDPETRNATLYVLRSTYRSKELFNYAFISGLSLIALILDLIMPS